MSLHGDGPSMVKILLVDNQPANLIALKAILDGLDMSLVEVHSGEQALRQVLEDEFAVVLLDVQMPGLDGFETAKLIRGREETRHTPIIFQTAHATDRATIEKAYALGAVDFLLKPLMPVVLRAKVMGFVELFQHRQQIKRHAEQLRQAERREFEQKLAEENIRLQEQREWLRVTLASIGDGVITTDSEGRVTFLNSVAESLTGWRQEQAASRPFTQVFPILNEYTRRPVDDPVGKVIQQGTVIGMGNHTILVTKDGKNLPIDDSAAPIQDQKGNVAGVVVVFRDVTARRQAERAARFLASIVESSDDAIIGKDVNGIITSWNRAAERLFGYSAAEAIGHPIAILAPPDRADEMPAILARIKRGEQVEHFDTARRTKDGRLVPISLTVSPIKDQDGQIVGASKIARDISERKRVEEMLREERERLHATLTGIGDAVIVTDAKGRVTIMNPVAQTLTGWKEEALGRPVEEVFRIINEQTQPIESPVSRVIREGRIVGLANHTVLLTKEGTEIPIDDSGAPVHNSEGEIVAVVLVFRDITERKQAEKKLRQREESLQFLAEASSTLAAVEDYASTLQKVARLAVPFFADWCVVDMVGPDGSLRRLAVSHAELEKVQQADALQQGYPPDLNDPYGPSRVLRTGESEMMEEIPDSVLVASARDEEHLRILRELGLKSYVCVPIQAWNKLLGVLTFVLAGSGRRYGPGDLRLADDLAHRAAVAIENALLYAELREVNRRKDEFLATLAHELRNPLAPIRNAVELLRRADGNADLIRHASRIVERQVAQMVRLVDDLLDISRITRGKIQLRKERVELATIVQSAVEASRPFIEAQDHQLTVTLPPEPVHLDADPTRVAQVFANLLDNAAKYTEKGGHIWLTADRQDREVVVSVRDTGIGIAAEHLPRIFEMFSQVEPALERSQGGLGIGLALVFGLVELHGGTIEARSGGIGMGSEFIVRLQVVDALVPVSEPGGDYEKPHVRPRCRILVVDDNRDAADSLAMMLRLMGHDIQMAHDGLEAVQASAAFRPDVVLLDIGLPRMNGYEAARRIREQPWAKNTVLVALTGWGQEEDKRRATDAGFDHHLTKPVEPAALERLLDVFSPAPL